MKNTVEDYITDEALTNAFGYANFGDVSKRDVVRYALLKTASGYHNGHTAQCIINELGLTTKKLTLTKKGKEYLYEAFRNGTNH